MKESEEHPPVWRTFKQNVAFRTELKAMEFNKMSTVFLQPIQGS